MKKPKPMSYMREKKRQKRCDNCGGKCIYLSRVRRLYGYKVRMKRDCTGVMVYHDPLDLAIYGETGEIAISRFREYMKKIDYNESLAYINNPDNWSWVDSLTEYACYA